MAIELSLAKLLMTDSLMESLTKSESMNSLIQSQVQVVHYSLIELLMTKRQVHKGAASHGCRVAANPHSRFISDQVRNKCNRYGNTTTAPPMNYGSVRT